MSEKKKSNSFGKFKSPKGLAIYAWLNTPDTKYKAEGEYKVTMRFSGDDAVKLKEQVDGFIEKAIDLAVEEAEEKARAKDPKAKFDKAKARAKVKLADKPYRVVEDEDQNETGELDFNFKSKASFIDKKTKETVNRTVPLFDAKGKKTGAIVYGGSELKVAYDVSPFSTAIGTGVSLRLDAVQIITLKTGGARDAAGFGFGEEDGYEAGEDDLPASKSSGSASADEEEF